VLTFLLSISANSLGLYLASRFIKGVNFSGDIIGLVLAGVILGVLNVTVKPLLKILSAPLILLTLGLFIIIINFFILWFLQFFITDLVISGFWAYFWTLAILTGANYLIHLVGEKREE